jgi:hypothetical protein
MKTNKKLKALMAKLVKLNLPVGETAKILSAHCQADPDLMRCVVEFVIKQVTGIEIKLGRGLVGRIKAPSFAQLKAAVKAIKTEERFWEERADAELELAEGSEAA